MSAETASSRASDGAVAGTLSGAELTEDRLVQTIAGGDGHGEARADG